MDWISFFCRLTRGLPVIGMIRLKPSSGTKSKYEAFSVTPCSFCDQLTASHLFSASQYGLPLKIVSYKDLYGWTMDEIVKVIGLKNNCTFCGVFRRQVQ